MTSRTIVAAAALVLLAAVFVVNASAKMPDFEVYWRAGVRALAAEPLYRADDGHYQLKYLPAFAILAIPAGLVPLNIAKAIWFAVSAGLVAALLALSLRLLPSHHKPAWALTTITLVAMAKFYGHELVLGQVNLLFATVVLIAVHLHMRGRSSPAGLLIALAIVIKPYAVLFVPWFAAQRAYGALAAAIVGIGGALALPVVSYGVGGTVALHLDWWRTVAESTAPNLLNPDNVSLAGMFAKWLGPGAAAAVLTAVTSIVLFALAAGVVLMRGGLAAPAGLEAGLLLMLVPLLSPQGWDYVFLVSTPAVLYLVNYDRTLPTAWRAAMWTALAVVAFSLYDVMGRRAYAAFMALSVITVCYLVLIAALAALRVRRIA